MAVLDIPEVVPPGTLPPSCRVRLIPRGTLMIVPQGMPNPTAPGRFGPKYRRILPAFFLILAWL